VVTDFRTVDRRNLEATEAASFARGVRYSCLHLQELEAGLKFARDAKQRGSTELGQNLV